jgi:hypothetical protein
MIARFAVFPNTALLGLGFELSTGRMLSADPTIELMSSFRIQAERFALNDRAAFFHVRAGSSAACASGRG